METIKNNPIDSSSSQMKSKDGVIISYCDQRLREIELSDTDIKIQVFREETYNSVSIYSSDVKDNILILYPSLFGSVEQYKKENKYYDYYRLRLNPLNIINGHKYDSPYGSASRYFYPPLIINCFQSTKEINTLIITEGEFKASVACKNGIHCVGIPGIHNIKDRESYDLPDDFLQLLAKCKVRNIIFLLDADCISSEYIKKCIQEGKDCFTRLNSFYSSVKAFRELCKKINVDVYFSRIKEFFIDKGKGIDDLLVHEKNKEVEVSKDLHKLASASIYFESINITDNSLNKLYEYFLLKRDGKGLPILFIERYSDIIGENEVLFSGVKYQCIDNKWKVVKHPDSLNYIRVGTDYYLLGYRISSKKEKIPELKPWKISTIKHDYPFIRNFTTMIRKYISFVNVPDNTDKYEKEINGCYNLYEPINHKPCAGEHSTTINFLKHIFKDKLDVALDYLTIIYKYPTQNLPVECLVSNENETGKSTYLKWTCVIFGNNAVILGNEDFASNFNSHYASKLIIGIDEGFIEKRLIKEKIKRLTTDDRINLEAKGKDQVRMDFIGKFILCSNNESNFIMMDKEDNRFFVVKVNQIEKKDPDLLDKLIKEIPAFLYFLSTREMTYKKEGRLWFRPDLYATDALTAVVKASRSKVEKELINWFEYMFGFEETGDIICITPKVAAQQIEQNLKSYSSISSDVETVFKTIWKLKHIGENKRFSYPYAENSIDVNSGEKGSVIRFAKENGKYYEIKKDFIQSII